MYKLRAGFWYISRRAYGHAFTPDGLSDFISLVSGSVTFSHKDVFFSREDFNNSQAKHGYDYKAQKCIGFSQDIFNLPDLEAGELKLSQDLWKGTVVCHFGGNQRKECADGCWGAGGWAFLSPFEVIVSMPSVFKHAGRMIPVSVPILTKKPPSRRQSGV